MLAGSKAGWLQIGVLYFLLPYSYLRRSKEKDILFLSIPAIVFVAFMSPLLFFGAFFYRITMTTSIDMDLFRILGAIDWTILGYLINEIFTRLAIGGFDRFMLICTTFLSSDVGPYAINEYVPYILKNGANMLLPGTPYSESYAPSSQLFPEVINLAPLDGDLSAAYLLSSINSQPYTIFGVLTILFGWLSPVLIFFYHILLSLLYKQLKNFYARITLIYFYFTAMQSFGIEIALGYAYHIIISLVFMHFFLLVLSKIHIRTTEFVGESTIHAEIK